MRILKNVLLITVPALAIVVVSGIVLAQSEGRDCPGKIVCPQTGELVCRDKCPTIDPNRPDCPGRIVCPLTGKLVCRDRCPAKQAETASGAQPQKVRSCCAAKG